MTLCVELISNERRTQLWTSRRYSQIIIQGSDQMQRTCLQIAAASAIMAGTCFASNGASVLDRLVFGNASSEEAHGLVSQGAQTGSSPGGRTYLAVGKGGFANFTLACAPLISVEFYGDDTLPDNEMIAVIPQHFGGKVSTCSYPPELHLCLTDRLGHECIGAMMPNRSQIVTMDLGSVANCSASRTMNLTIASQGSERTPGIFQIFANGSSGSAGLFDPDLSLVPAGARPPPAGPRTRGSTMPDITSQGDFLRAQVAAGTQFMREF